MDVKKCLKQILPYGFVAKRLEKQKVITRETSVEPEVYNSKGERMRTFYLKDHICQHSPYTFSSQTIGKSSHILWDRFNKALPIHFYTHKDIFEKHDSCQKKFAFLLESEEIAPKDYEEVLSRKEEMKDFDAVFTHSERLLDALENAKFIPGSSVWYGGTAGGGIMIDNAWERKCKNISLVSSDKASCDLHKYRLQLASWLHDSEIVDVLGTFGGGKFVSISESLTEYRYSIAVENCITSCYFTEKILNCFAAMTVPVYVGATGIDKFFDPEGIIQINPAMDQETILKILSKCGPEDYLRRLPAIQENYKRVQAYLCVEDYIYDHYASLFDLEN